MGSLSATIRAWAKGLKRDATALWLAARDPRVPWHAKVLAGMVAAYAFSPIDLIPDFIPVLGLLDDLILVPVGIWLVIRMIPPVLFAQLRERAADLSQRPVSRTGAAAVIVLWIAGCAVTAWLASAYFRQGA